MTIEELDKIIEVAIGQTNFNLLSELGVDSEFSAYGPTIIELYNMGMQSMKNGNLDPKRLMEINETFDVSTIELCRKVTFGKDQNGIAVTLEQLFGEIKSVRPEYMPYKLAVIMSLWIIERKLRLHYEEQAGKKTTYEAVRIAGV
jgi:hypothetical protein